MDRVKVSVCQLTGTTMSPWERVTSDDYIVKSGIERGRETWKNRWFLFLFTPIPASDQGWLYEHHLYGHTEPWAQKGPGLGWSLCVQCLEILTIWTNSSAFLFCTGFTCNIANLAAEPPFFLFRSKLPLQCFFKQCIRCTFPIYFPKES